MKEQERIAQLEQQRQSFETALFAKDATIAAVRESLQGRIDELERLVESSCAAASELERQRLVDLDTAAVAAAVAKYERKPFPLLEASQDGNLQAVCALHRQGIIDVDFRDQVFA